MKGLIFLACFLLGPGIQAQLVTGKVLDDDDEALFGATVMLLQAKDSVLTSFAMTADGGAFEIKRVPDGEYILRINFVGFDGKDQKVIIANEDVNVGNVLLVPNVLAEVVIEGAADPIVLKKDTVEYNAAAFETKANAVVEDLLRKLPGVEVERDGTVKSQGETVQKVLVDGKEFFGNDAKMATKNLPANAVDKVQVFDQKSEFSQFSGVDDGNEEKTINLTLKEDHKKGTFGNVSGGYGTDGRYQLSANVNQFREDNQFSFIGKHNNINEQGFSTGEYISFMGGLGNLSSGGGGFRIGGAGVPISNGLSDGFVNSSAAGLNFNRDFSEKLEMRASYLFSRIENITNKETDRTNFVNDESFDTNEKSDNNSDGSTHSVNLNLKYKIDKTQDLEIRNVIGFQNGDVSNITNTLNNRDGNTTSSLSDYQSKGTGQNINTDLTYRKKFPKIGRTFVTEFNVSASRNDSEYDLETRIDDETPVVQEQESLNKSTTFGAELAFTEPIGKSKYLEFRYIRNVTDGVNDKDFYDGSGGSSAFNSALSSNYERNYTYNRTGLSFNLAKDDFRFTTGVNYQFSTLLGELPEQGGQRFENEFNRVLPFLRTNYDVSQSLGISFNYSSQLNVPSVSQLQPVLDNSNPLNLYQGNPNLDAEYEHSGRLSFRFFDQFSSTSFFSFFNASYTLDNIVSSRNIDANSVITTTPVNADNSLTLTGYSSFSRPIKPIKTRIRLSDRLSRNEGFAIVNNVTSETTNINNTVSFSLENIKKEIVDWSVGLDHTNGKTKGSQESANQNFSNQVYFVDATLYFLKKWSLNSVFDYNIYSSASFAGDQEVQLWEASLKKTMLKNDRGELKLSVFDILNQNRGVNRTTDFNYIQEERIASLGTYYMVSFTYRLSAFEQKSGFRMDRRRG